MNIPTRLANYSIKTCAMHEFISMKYINNANTYYRD